MANGRSSYSPTDDHTSPTLPGGPSSSAKSSTTQSHGGASPSSFTATPGVAGHILDLFPVDCFLQLFDQCALELLHTETLHYLEQYLEDKKEYLEEHPNAGVHDLVKHPITLEDYTHNIILGSATCLVKYNFRTRTGSKSERLRKTRLKPDSKFLLRVRVLCF